MLDLNEIINIDSIGKMDNPININEMLAKVASIEPATKDAETTLLLGIDLQYDFLENGSLAVPGSHDDLQRLLGWTYDNMSKITSVKLSKDTHNVFQIFHPSWWQDSSGEKPQPLTAITLQDMDANNWIPIVNPIGSRDYVENLEKLGKKTLVIWPYHCIQGTLGCAIDSQLMNLILYHSTIRRTRLDIMVKGTSPMSEMYGIFKPEYDARNIIDLKILNAIANYDRIVITGQAKSHCVLETIAQMLEHYQGNQGAVQKMFVLEDTMSIIPSFEDSTNESFDEFRSKGVNLVTTQDYSL